MRRKRGPTKRLIPSTRSETLCPHRYVEEEGLQLEIDCLECPGPQDLGTSRCLAGVVGVLTSGAAPESIVLKGYIHKRYRGEALAHASRIAIALARVNRAISSAETPSDKMCRTCPASMERVMTATKEMILRAPDDFPLSVGPAMDEIRSKAAHVDCKNSAACVNRALAGVLSVSGRR